MGPALPLVPAGQRWRPRHRRRRARCRHRRRRLRPATQARHLRVHPVWVPSPGGGLLVRRGRAAHPARPGPVAASGPWSPCPGTAIR